MSTPSWPNPITLPEGITLSDVSGSEALTILAEKILANLAIGVVVQRPDGAIISANDAACAILSLSQEQLRGRTSFDPSWHAVDEDGEFLPGERHPAMETVETAEACHKAMGIYSGSPLLTWIDVHASPILDSEMNLVGVSTSFVNISDLREALDREVATKKYYARLSEESSEVVLTVDANGKVLTASESSADLFGHPAKSLLGMRLESVVPETAVVAVRTLINNVSAAAGNAGYSFSGYIPFFLSNL